jgi:hypothetical protein
MVLEYEAQFMEILWYAPHLNTEKLRVNRFVFSLNGSIRAKVRILMPHSRGGAFQWGSAQDSSQTSREGAI